MGGGGLAWRHGKGTSEQGKRGASGKAKPALVRRRERERERERGGDQKKCLGSIQRFMTVPWPTTFPLTKARDRALHRVWVVGIAPKQNG